MAIQLRCGKWLAKTPAQFDAPEQGRQYYVGTLRVDLFGDDRYRGGSYGFSEGTLRAGTRVFAVADEWSGRARIFAPLRKALWASRSASCVSITRHDRPQVVARVA